MTRTRHGGRAPAVLLAAWVLAGCGVATTTRAPSPRATVHPPGVSGATSSASVPPATMPPATTATTTAPAVAGLALGPGARARYTVEPQPAPGSCHYSYVGPYPLPDPSCTPGALDPGVTPADLATTICSTGWTATVRPPERVTGPEKEASAAAYGYTGSFATAEYDHLVPLELGGDPNDSANLWIEPNDRPGATDSANTKDLLEDHLRALVCAGSLPLGVAQQAIAADWVAAMRRYGT